MEKALKILQELVKDRKYDEMWYFPSKSAMMEAITELEAMKHKTCEGCKHKPNEGECYYEPCGTCARFFYDHYEPKE